MSRRNRSAQRARLAAGLLALVLAGCGSGDGQPATQPAPGVSTFEQGRFDELPQFPRSEPLGPRSEKDGVVTRSYEARGTSPERVLEFYREALDEGWNMVSPIEKLGVGTFRAEWVDEDYRLLVSATRGPAIDPPDDASNEVVAQYSLALHPL